MTEEIDISTTVNSKEILPQYREQLEIEIKDIFLWAIGQNALTEMTKTIGEKEPRGRLEKNFRSGKKCEFENVTAAELLASKFLSLIGKSTGVYDLEKKIRKSDMSIEAITEAIQEYMYEKLN